MIKGKDFTEILWKCQKKYEERKLKLNSCSHDIHVFMPARRQFSVQTGVSGGKQCGEHYWTLKLLYATQGQTTGEKRKDMKKKVERKEKRNLCDKSCSDGEKKKQHILFWLNLKLSKRDNSRVISI